VRTAVVVVDSETVDVVVDWGIEVVVEGIVEVCADVGGSAGVVVAVSDVPQALMSRVKAMTVILDFDPMELMTGGYIRSATDSGRSVPTLGERHRSLIGLELGARAGFLSQPVDTLLR
jgi:hypothetical protein